MAFTVFQQRTIQGWRDKGYRVLSQTLMDDHSYEMCIARRGGPDVTVLLLPNGRFSKVFPASHRRVA